MWWGFQYLQNSLKGNQDTASRLHYCSLTIPPLSLHPLPYLSSVQFSSVQSPSHVQLFAIPWTAALQASLSSTISQSLLKLMFIESVMTSISSSVIPFFFYLQSFPASGSFPVSQLFASGGQSIGASASVLPVNIQDWFPLGSTGLIFLQSKGLSTVFSNTTVWKHQLWKNKCPCYIYHLKYIT